MTNRSFRGFTIIEIMITVAIIGILSASLYPVVGSYLGRARNTTRVNDIRNIASALEQYRIDQGDYPTGIGYMLNTQQLISSTTTTWTTDLGQQLQPYLPKMPINPIKTMSYYYGIIQDQNANYPLAASSNSDRYGDDKMSYTLYAQLEGVESWKNFKSKNIDASNPLAISELPSAIKVKDDAGVKIFSIVGDGGYFSNELMPIDITKSYKISVDIRSAGSGGLSSFYFGLANYDENQEIITIDRVYILGNDPVISSYTDTDITTTTPITGWQGVGTQTYSRGIGFYYNGDSEKIPRSSDIFFYVPDPFYYSTESHYGVYSIYSSNTITLNSPIPPSIQSQIIPGVTKLRNHSWGGWYQYIFYGTAPSGWTHYEFTLKGEDPNWVGSYGTPPGTFRKGTKFVKFLILPNYQQDSTRELYLNNLTFERIN